MSTVQAAKPLEVPLSIYDAQSGQTRQITLYFDASKSETRLGVS